MKFKKNENVLWNGEPAIIWDVLKKNPMNGNPVKWYTVKRDINSIPSHLVSEDSGTLEKIMKCYECGKLSPHTEYRIKGFRSRCCNA